MNENTPNKVSHLFPELAPYATHHVPVGDGHTLYVAQFGNPNGIPVVVLHGGPGTGFGEKAPRRFDPTKYHIICFDQRGAGRSTPTGSLVANTTAHLVQDIDILRTYLNIENWAVYGTSWGCTLALAYAQSYPDHVLALTIGGVFLGSEEELDWISKPEGLPHLRWPQFQALQGLFPGNPTGFALYDALYKALSGPNANVAYQAALAFAMYECSAFFPSPDMAAIREYAEADPHLTSHITIEVYYFLNRCFLVPNQLLNNYARIATIPTWIVQGGLDFGCPPATAQKLHAVLPSSQLTIAPLSGHVTDDDLEAARVAATNAMAHTLTHKAE